MLADDGIERPAPPTMVEKSRALAYAFQSGRDSVMLDIMRPCGKDTPNPCGLVADLMAALYAADDRTLTYAAPQVAALAERVGWLTREKV